MASAGKGMAPDMPMGMAADTASGTRVPRQQEDTPV